MLSVDDLPTEADSVQTADEGEEHANREEGENEEICIQTDQ